MTDTGVFAKIVKAVYHYFVFFALVAFVTSCCIMLFLSTFATNLNLNLTADNLNTAAKMTFGNVLLISFLFMVLDVIRRKLTVEKPVCVIVEGAEKIMQGDFNVQIKKPITLVGDETFDEIIACFNRMAKELQGVETLRTDFIANVSHEMKTPLSVMQNYAVLLRAENLPHDTRALYADKIIDTAQAMASMMTNILKLNQLENQTIFPKVEEFDLGEQLCECLLQYESVWEEKNIEIINEIADGVIVRQDKELLRLVWNNLLSNAFKFTPAGGSVSVSMTAGENCIAVKISDTGCGMSAEVGAHIFEKFYQGGNSHKEQGNGLGLALVKRVIDILHGEISVESAVGIGTSFVVTIRRS